MNLENIKNQLITAKKWQDKSYLLNKVFAKRKKLFPTQQYKNFTSWLSSVESEAKKQGLTGYSVPTLMSLRTTGGFYISITHNINFDQEIKKNGSAFNLVSTIKECKVPSYKALHMVSTKKQKPSKEIMNLIVSGKLEREHVSKSNKVTPLIVKLKKELKNNQDALRLLETLESAVA